MNYEKLINDVFMQGDVRYTDILDEETALDFLKNDAILIEKHDITKLDEQIRDIPTDIRPPQERLKFLATVLFKEKNIDLIGFERRNPYGIADVLGKLANKTIMVECGPCYIHNGFDYLREDATELWIVTGEFTGKSEIATLFIVRRGPNWTKMITSYDQNQRNKIMSVKSPLDILPKTSKK